MGWGGGSKDPQLKRDRFDVNEPDLADLKPVTQSVKDAARKIFKKEKDG